METQQLNYQHFVMMKTNHDMNHIFDH